MYTSVSIVIPVYGRPGQVSAALSSINRQTGLSDLDIQVIVVDDGSPEPLSLDHFPSVKVIRHAENRGAAAARNTGAQAAAGDLIAFLDSDDVWLPQKLETQIALFERLSDTHDSDLLVVGSGFFDPNRRSGDLRARLPMDADQPHLFASGCWFAPGSSVLMRRKAFDIVGRQDEAMRRLEDLDWFIRLGQAGGKYFCTGTHDVVIRPSGSAPFEAVMTAVDQLTAKFGPDGATPLAPRTWNRLAAYLSLEKAVAYVGNRQLGPGVLELLKTILRKPRLRPAVERFWIESADIPREVDQVFAQMLETQE